MKMKEFGLREVRFASALLGSTTDADHLVGSKLDEVKNPYMLRAASINSDEL